MQSIDVNTYQAETPECWTNDAKAEMAAALYHEISGETHAVIFDNRNSLKSEIARLGKATYKYTTKKAAQEDLQRLIDIRVRKREKAGMPILKVSPRKLSATQFMSGIRAGVLEARDLGPPLPGRLFPRILAPCTRSVGTCKYITGNV